MIELRGVLRKFGGSQTGEFGGRRDAAQYDSAGDENGTQQLLKSITNQFYMHKSFEIQSDMEFLPAIVGQEADDRRGVVHTPNATGTELMANLTSLEMLMNKRLAEIQAITQRHKQQQQQQQHQQHIQAQQTKEMRITSPKVFDRYSPPSSRRRGSANPNYNSYNNSNNSSNNNNNNNTNNHGHSHNGNNNNGYNRRQVYGHQNSHNNNGNNYNNQGGYNSMNHNNNNNSHHNYGQRNW